MAFTFQANTNFNARDNVSGKVDRMTRSTRRFGRQSDRSFRKASRAGSRFRQVLGGMLGAAALQQAGKAAIRVARTMTTELAEQGNEISQMSERLGIASSSYQELGFAAGQYNVEQEALTDGLKEMSLRADEFAQTGAGPAAEAMERLGLTQSQINAQKGDTEGLFNLMINKMQNIEDVAARQRIADELFGGQGGEQMVQFVSEGAENIDRLRERAEELGVVMDGDALAAARNFTEQQKEASAALTGLRNTAFIPLLEKITPLIEKFTEFVAEEREMIKLKVEQVIEKVAAGFRVAVDWIGRAWEFMQRVNDMVGGNLIPILLSLIGIWKVYTVVQSIVNAVMAANPIGLIITGIAALIAIVVLLVKNWEKVGAFFARLWEGIKNAFISAGEFIWNYFLKWTPTGLIIQYWRPLLDFFIGLWGGIETKTTEVFSRLAQFFVGIWNGIKRTFQGAVNFIRGIIDGIIDRVMAVIGKVGEIKDKVSGFFQGAGDFIGGIFGGGNDRGGRGSGDQMRGAESPNSREAAGYRNPTTIDGRFEFINSPDNLRYSDQSKPGAPQIDMVGLGANY